MIRMNREFCFPDILILIPCHSFSAVISVSGDRILIELLHCGIDLLNYFLVKKPILLLLTFGVAGRFSISLSRSVLLQ